MSVRVVLSCFILVFCLGPIGAFPSSVSYTFFGTEQPAPPAPNTGPSNFNGVACDPLNPNPPICIPVSGDARAYQPFYVKLSGDTSTGIFNLEIQTNAPLNYGTGASTLAFGDVLLKGGGNPGDPLYWGISVGSGQTEPGSSNLPSASTTQGDLYEVAHAGNGSTLISYDAMYLTPSSPGVNPSFAMASSYGRGAEPIWINPGPVNGQAHAMGDVGGSTAFNIATPGCAAQAVDAADLNCGIDFKLYTITDTFAAPAAFSNMLASGVFSLEFSSFVCANGLIIASPSSVPEPRAVSLILLGVLLLAGQVARSRKVHQVN